MAAKKKTSPKKNKTTSSTSLRKKQLIKRTSKSSKSKTKKTTSKTFHNTRSKKSKKSGSKSLKKRLTELFIKLHTFLNKKITIKFKSDRPSFKGFKEALNNVIQSWREKWKSQSSRRKKVKQQKKFGFKSKKSRYLLVSLLLLTIAGATWFYWYIIRDLPSPSNLSGDNYPVSTLIYDRNGQLLFEIFSDENRTPVALNQLPEYIKQATIAIEDKNFYEHKGLSYTGIFRAVAINSQYLLCQFTPISCPSSFQGGSTITQQLIKNSLLTPERTIQRKIREALLTLVVETRYSKDQILEMYLNQVPYGGTAYGIQAAAKNYFNKDAENLTLAEATVLAGLPQAPTRFSPFGVNPDAYKQRQESVVRRMQEDGYISDMEANQILTTDIEFNTQSNLSHAPHFVLWIKELLVNKYGEQLVEQGGLRVTTTLDLQLQEFAQKAVSNEVAELEDYNVSNGAALVTHPPTGQILAMVGSADYFNRDIDGNVNFTLRYRQPGSSIKPLNYVLGINNGSMFASSLLADIPTCFSVTGQNLYCPVNYDGVYHGATQLRYALANSYNIPAVRVLAKNGVDAFISAATFMGITGWNDRSQFGLALTLGGGEVRMLDLSTAYATMANLGLKVTPNPILRVETYTGELLQERSCGNYFSNQEPEQGQQNTPPPMTDLAAWDSLEYPFYCEGQRVLRPEAAYIIDDIMSDNQARSFAFGSNSELRIRNYPNVAVKTGTTNDLRDNWTVGFTPDRLIATWVGNFDNSKMSRVASGVTGAAPIWNDIMTYSLDNFYPGKAEYNQAYLESLGSDENDKEQVEEDQEDSIEKPDLDKEFYRPEDVIDLAVCRESGLAVSPDPNQACSPRSEMFIKDEIPQHHNSMKRPWPIDKTTNRPATDRTPVENIEMRDHLVFFDILGTAVCVDCAPPEDPVIINYPLTEDRQ